MTDTNIPAPTNRRGDSERREMFLQVYEVLQPFFDAANQWAGQNHQHLAYRALHEHFPQLSPETVSIFVTAAQRVFQSGRSPAP